MNTKLEWGVGSGEWAKRLLRPIPYTLLPSLLSLILGLVGPVRAAPTPPDPEAAMQSFLSAYWDPDLKYFLAWNRAVPFSRPSGAGPRGGKYSDFWWEAQLWDLVMDAYERDPKPQYRALIDEVYDGFVAQYPDWRNDYNDDLGWWAQGAARAYRLTQNRRYLDRARTLFDDIWSYWDDTQGGGVSWRRSNRAQKNIATNGPLTVTAVRLYQATGERDYLEKAERLWNWMDSQLTDRGSRVYDNWENGELRKWDFTYNFGNFILASLALREVSKDAAKRAMYLERSLKAASWVFENLTNAGILLDEGQGDGGGFKGVFVRALRRLMDVRELEPSVGKRLSAFLNDNATQVWNVRRASDGLVGSDWSSPAGVGAVESITAASAVAVLLLAPGPFPARWMSGNGCYEAENAIHIGVQPSIAALGFTARGYINHFFKDGQAVVFRVNVAKARRYRITLRYSAGGGAASRRILVKREAPFRLEIPTSVDWSEWVEAALVNFPATPDWRTWAETDFEVELPAGASALAVRYERGAGSRGWLNLDHLKIQTEAR